MNVGGESDDEEWFEDESHPIDWYVALINSIVTSSPNAGIALEERTRLKFAWDTFMPGGRCIFTSCQAPRETPRKFSCDGRYARHLVEYHRRIRPVFGCNDRKGQFLCRSAENETRPFRTLRRGLFVRHINDGQASHRLSVENALGIVHKLIAADQPKEDGGASATAGSSISKYYMTWESNGGDEANRARLHIMSEMFPAFHGMNPWYRSHYRAIMVARAAEHKKNGTKRAHSTDVRGSQKKQKPASSPAPTPKEVPKASEKSSSAASTGGQSRDSRSRAPKTSTSSASSTGMLAPAPVRPSGPTFSAVVSEEKSGVGFKPPPAPTREAPAASQGASSSGCWSDLAPYGSVSDSGHDGPGVPGARQGDAGRYWQPGCRPVRSGIPGGGQLLHVAFVAEVHSGLQIDS